MIPREHLDGYPVLEMAVGESRNFDHNQCPAGADHRGRLSVLRKANNLWLVYCYNCGDGNALRVAGSGGEANTEWTKNVLDMLTEHLRPDTPIIEDVMVNTTKYGSLPEDVVVNGEKWDVWAHERLWASHTNVGMVTAPPYNWCFSPSRNQIIMPIYGPDREEWGYQARQAPGIKPKCITTYYQGHNGKPLYYKGVGPWLFIVEDPISAMRINHCCEHHSVALLGTHLNETALVDIIKAVNWYGISNIAVWFDDDAAGKEASHKAYYRLAKMFYPPHCKVRTYTYLEPKQIVDLKGHVEEWTSRS